MLCFDTGFLVPPIIPEDTSEPIAAFFECLPDEDLAVSHRTRVEFASLLAREVRMGGLDHAAAREAGSKLEAMVGESFIIFVPDRDDFDRARDWLGHSEFGLRAGDALRLAITENRGADEVYTLDKPMITAGKRLGLPSGRRDPLAGLR